MRVSSDVLDELKRRVQGYLRDAEHIGEPNEIAKANQYENLVDDLIKRNGNLTLKDYIELQILFDRLGPATDTGRLVHH